MDAAETIVLRTRNGGERMIPAQRVLPVFAAVVLVILAFAAFDVLLVRIARQHQSELAKRLFERALLLQTQGKPQEALELFRSAYNEAPSNPQYHISFIRALRKTGRESQAMTALLDLLQRHPADGPANTEMARMLAGAGDARQAAWYYHRALYGEWSRPPDLRQLRFELADLLAGQGSKQELLAEILLLDPTPWDEDDARHLARLMVAANAWPRAEELYRRLLRRNRSDAELWAGLGQAQMGSGQYLAAERSFRRAVNLGDAAPSVRRELELAERIRELDPTARGLSNREKHRRAHELAAALLNAMNTCSPDATVVGSAKQSLAAHSPTVSWVDAAETDLDVIEKLWAARDDVCHALPPLPKEVAVLGAHVSK